MKGSKKILGGNGYVPHLECGIVLTDYAHMQNYQVVYSKYVQFIECQLHLNKVAIVLKQTQPTI